MVQQHFTSLSSALGPGSAHSRPGALMRSRAMRPQLAFRWLLPIGLSCLFSPAAGATALSVRASPDVATWRDTITVAVTGDGCGATLAAPNVLGAPPRIQIDVVSTCNADAAQPFELATTLDKLEPGLYQVVVRNGVTGESAHASLEILEPARPLVEVPADATSDRPVTVHVVGLGSCPSAERQSWVGNVIELRGAVDCNFDPPLGYTRPFDIPVELGRLAPGDYAVRLRMVEWSGSLAVTTLHVARAGSCTPSDSALCLQDGRFRVEASWSDFDGHAGVAHPATGAEKSSGLLWFFSPDKLELTVKVLDGCAITGTHWLFVSSSSTVPF